MYDYDLFVIGAGSGGVRGSRLAAQYGAKVACAESTYLGGTCVNVGCVPKKLFVYGSHFLRDVEDARNFGWDMQGTPELDWNRFIGNKDEEIQRLNGVYKKILNGAGVTLVEGRATLKDPHTVTVNGKDYTTEKILVATGSWPFVPPIEGSEFAITSNDVFFLKKKPERVVIVGAGYIAVEFAGVFNGYGCDVLLVHRGTMILDRFDSDVRSFLQEEMEKKGIKFRFKCEVSQIKKNEETGVLTATFCDGTFAECDVVLFATGRRPNTEGLGLEEVGVKMSDRGAIVVDEYSRSSCDHIFAVGDVTNRMNLTPVALAEAACFADTEFGGKKRSVQYEAIPTAVFAQPAIGTCGLTEEEARKEYGDDIDLYKTNFRALKHTITKRDERTFMKMIVRRSTDKVLGVHVVEPAAGEIIQLVGVAMKAGATKADFDSTIGVHPTSAEELVTLRTKSL
uniref:Glutathione reductase n=1 Tax=Compsopogon caeruleus TaxID=31354 RepID=A0A7S1TB37_9RHOD|mmetsp:Transcript_15533/g.31429  ORF Transcript_15533/g.31429 Transcript_15533/m.31429 type:complete len:453 (+) Transcript_15533:62-1420(+)